MLWKAPNCRPEPVKATEGHSKQAQRCVCSQSYNPSAGTGNTDPAPAASVQTCERGHMQQACRPHDWLAPAHGIGCSWLRPAAHRTKKDTSNTACTSRAVSQALNTQQPAFRWTPWKKSNHAVLTLNLLLSSALPCCSFLVGFKRWLSANEPNKEHKPLSLTLALCRFEFPAGSSRALPSPACRAR